MSANRHRVFLAACFLLTALLPIGMSAAQKSKDPRPILTRNTVNKRDWTLHAEVRIHPSQDWAFDDIALSPSSNVVLDELEFFYPLIESSAMHKARLDRLTSKLQVNNRDVDKEPDIVTGYQAGTSLGVWKASQVNTNLITLWLEVPMSCYETDIDEGRAFQVKWPKEEWEPLVASCLEPQVFVEVNDDEIQNLVREWTNGNPKKAMPYALAKHLAGKVIEHYMPTDGIFHTAALGGTVGTGRASFISGYNVRGAAVAARDRRGSPLDLANLLCAVYRAAGIPARLVIGLEQERSDEFIQPIIRPWVEFYLLDERTNLGEWIPVDIIKQKEFSSRAPPLRQKWEFFGKNQLFDFMVPISHHWHPPEAVVNLGPPGIWGWLPKPAVPVADCEIRTWAYGTVSRGDDPEHRTRNRGR